MLRQPRGCFEQTSSSNYPNLLVLDYLQATKKNDPALERHALDLLDVGYKRLQTFEVKGGGFDWYGKAPAHEGLTAYGLMQFVDMQRVYPVKQSLIDRTARWLLSRRDGKGGWLNAKEGLHRWSGTSMVHNAYIVWALTQAGYGNRISSELDQSYRDAMETKDPYILALVANSLHRLHDERAGKVAALLASLQNADGSWTGLSHSMTHSSGQALIIETSALAILAQLADQKKPFKGLTFLAAAKTPYGFASTQSTVLALKALTEFAKYNKSQGNDGRLKILIDGKKVADNRFSTLSSSNLIIDQLAPYFTEGRHEVEIVYDNKGEALPFDLAINYHTNLPRGQAACEVSLDTRLAQTDARMGQNVRLSTELRNKTDRALPNTIAMVGIPAGLSLQPWQLKEIQEKGLCDYYELIDNYIVFHYRGLDPNASRVIHLDLKADIPGKYEAPASVAYLYYNDEYRYWIKPATIEILP